LRVERTTAISKATQTRTGQQGRAAADTDTDRVESVHGGPEREGYH
jgi:hypothetical protein